MFSFAYPSSHRTAKRYKKKLWVKSIKLRRNVYSVSFREFFFFLRIGKIQAITPLFKTLVTQVSGPCSTGSWLENHQSRPNPLLYRWGTSLERNCNLPEVTRVTGDKLQARTVISVPSPVLSQISLDLIKPPTEIRWSPLNRYWRKTRKRKLCRISRQALPSVQPASDRAIYLIEHRC